MKSIIVLPTYNEKENLAPLVKEILELGLPNMHILIVDDNSPDGTGEIADRLARDYERVKVLHRPEKQGLGRAYVAGFKKALADKEVAYIFEMDADFSHQPKYLPDFLKKIKKADLVIGSRNIKNGRVENWSWLRRLISYLANIAVRKIINVEIHDLTGGFKCWRRATLESLDLDLVDSSGYNFQIELTYKAVRKGFKVVEIPIVFVERRAGRSKFNFWIILESFWKVLKLKFFSS